MTAQKPRVALSFAVGILAVVGLLALLGQQGAGPGVTHAETMAVRTVCKTAPTDCEYATVQAALDAAGEGDLIKIATGVYTDVYGRPRPPNYVAPPGLTTVYQVAYITRSVTLRGGYTTAFTDPPDPEANPTTLDAHGAGRAVLVAGEISATLEGLRITGGDAAGLAGEGGPYDSGGGVYGTDATITLSDNLIFSNTAHYGGGMHLRYNVAILSNNAVYSNSAYFGGGARLYYNDVVSITGNTFEYNSASAGGGLVAGYSYDVTISGNTIYSNTAVTGVSQLGGGLYLAVISGTISGNTIISNTAGEYGGGVYLASSDNARLADNTISFNTGLVDGGGLRIWYSGAMLISNTITANTAGSGAGLESWFGNPTLLGNTIVSNTATGGGGCGLVLGRSDATLINNIISGNPTPANTGSGLVIRGSAPRLVHTTIAGNGGNQGYGLIVGSYSTYDSSVVMTNTILTGHKWGLSVSFGNVVMLQGTLWDNLFDLQGTGTVVTGTVNVWGDPAFVNAGAGDYHLGLGSAAIDEGVNAGVVTDIDGEPRPMGFGYEIGADEVEGIDLPNKIYVPLVLRNP